MAKTMNLNVKPGTIVLLRPAEEVGWEIGRIVCYDGNGTWVVGTDDPDGDGIQEVPEDQIVVPVIDASRHISCAPFTEENLAAVGKMLKLGPHFQHARPFPHFACPQRCFEEYKEELIYVHRRVMLAVATGANWDSPNEKKGHPLDVRRDEILRAKGAH